MRGGGAGEPFEVIAAIEHRNDAALRVSPGDLHEPRHRPGKIREGRTADIIADLIAGGDSIRKTFVALRPPRGAHPKPYRDIPLDRNPGFVPRPARQALKSIRRSDHR